MVRPTRHVRTRRRGTARRRGGRAARPAGRRRWRGRRLRRARARRPPAGGGPARGGRLASRPRCQRRRTSTAVRGVEVVEDLAEDRQVVRRRRWPVSDVGDCRGDMWQCCAPRRRLGHGAGEAIGGRDAIGPRREAGGQQPDAARRLDGVVVARRRERGDRQVVLAGLVPPSGVVPRIRRGGPQLLEVDGSVSPRHTSMARNSSHGRSIVASSSGWTTGPSAGSGPSGASWDR